MVKIQSRGAPVIAGGGDCDARVDAIEWRMAPHIGQPPSAVQIRTLTSAPQIVCDRDDAIGAGRRGILEASALGITAWSQRWFPDTFIFALLALASVVLGALLIGATPSAIAVAFGDGFWNLIPFTMQMVMVVITGHVVASARPTQKLIKKLARVPRSGRGAIVYIAVVSMTTSLLSWAMSVIVGGLLARELAQRRELHMDYRAAGAAAYLGMGATWTLGLSSSAAQLQANAESMPHELLAISGVVPFTKTIFLWQSIFIAAAIMMVASAVAYFSAPESERAVTAENLGVDVTSCEPHMSLRRRPGEWLEYSPILTLLLMSLGCGWLLQELAAKSASVVISSLNTYNLALLLLGLLLHWRPRHFLDAFSAAVGATPGILIQFPIYAGLGAILVNAKGDCGLSHHLAMIADHAASAESFAVLVGLYSTLTGIFLPSGGGRWIIEAPFIIQAANDLHVSLGWAVVSFSAAGALPNLINPFWMVPLLGILRLSARDLMGFTLTQFVALGPIVLVLLWVLTKTLS